MFYSRLQDIINSFVLLMKYPMPWFFGGATADDNNNLPQPLFRKCTPASAAVRGG